MKRRESGESIEAEVNEINFVVASIDSLFFFFIFHLLREDIQVTVKTDYSPSFQELLHPISFLPLPPHRFHPPPIFTSEEKCNKKKIT